MAMGARMVEGLTEDCGGQLIASAWGGRGRSGGGLTFGHFRGGVFVIAAAALECGEALLS